MTTKEENEQLKKDLTSLRNKNRKLFLENMELKEKLKRVLSGDKMGS